MDKKELRKLEAMEKAEKVGKALDRGVDMADEKLSQVPSKLGKHKPKIMLALVIIMVFAFVRDPNLAWVAAAIFAVLYSSQIISAMKLQMLKNAAKKEAKQVLDETLPKEEAAVAVLVVKKED